MFADTTVPQYKMMLKKEWRKERYTKFRENEPEKNRQQWADKFRQQKTVHFKNIHKISSGELTFNF